MWGMGEGLGFLRNEREKIKKIPSTEYEGDYKKTVFWSINSFRSRRVLIRPQLATRETERTRTEEDKPLDQYGSYEDCGQRRYGE